MPHELPHRQRRAHRQRLTRAGPLRLRLARMPDPVREERVRDRLDARRGQRRLADPAAGPLLVGGGRRHALLHPGAEHRAVHDPVLLALEPVVPPAHHLLEVADRRTRLAQVRELVRPRADQSLAGHVDVLQQPGHRVGVPVGPAAGGQHRHLERGVVLADRGVPPVGVAPLVAQPLHDPRPAALQPLVPQLAPALPDDGRVGRAGGVGEHGARLGEVVGEHRPAHVVHVVVVPVVGERGEHHRLQARRAPGRRLERGERAPGDAHHAGGAVAPRLVGDPGQHLLGVLLLPLQVLVAQHPSESPVPRRSTRRQA